MAAVAADFEIVSLVEGASVGFFNGWLVGYQI